MNPTGWTPYYRTVVRRDSVDATQSNFATCLYKKLALIKDYLVVSTQLTGVRTQSGRILEAYAALHNNVAVKKSHGIDDING